MQTSELEKKQNHLLADEECINFRPSPNFKHMRKYLKSKFEEANSSPNQNSDQSTTPNSEEHDNVKPVKRTSNNMAQRVQPPLPPNSPPLELVVPKQEIVDDEYNDKPIQATFMKEVKVDVPGRRPKTMCRQFIRGTCVRGAACIYVHEVILDQLPGVYTFCKNFQNKECKLSKCKFVHASVFEKEHFYRTGYLPPHTLAHLKESNSALAPSTAIEGPVEVAHMFSNPPPPIMPGVSSLPPHCAPDGRQPDIFVSSLASLKQGSSSKREWSEMDLAMAAQEHDSSEPMLKKCKSCDVHELRLQCTKAKVDKYVEQMDMFAKQRCQLSKWENRLQEVFDVVLKLNNVSGPSIANKLNSAISRNEDNNVSGSSIANKLNSAISRNEDTSMDQLSMFLQYTSRLSEMDGQQKLILKQVLKEIMNEKGNASPISR